MFETFIKKIREAVYGRDVREAIAGALENAYNDSQTSAVMEVIAARGNYDSLGDRMDGAESEINNTQNYLEALEAQMTELNRQINLVEKFKLFEKELSLSEDISGGGYDSNTGVMNEGTGVIFPIFDLVEDPDSLLAVIYYVKYEQQEITGLTSFPAFIRSGETKGYYATAVKCAYTGATYYCTTNGPQLNSKIIIDTERPVSFQNYNSSKKMKLKSVKAFIVTRW